MGLTCRRKFCGCLIFALQLRDFKFGVVVAKWCLILSTKFFEGYSHILHNFQFFIFYYEKNLQKQKKTSWGWAGPSSVQVGFSFCSQISWNYFWALVFEWKWVNIKKNYLELFLILSQASGIRKVLFWVSLYAFWWGYIKIISWG